MQEEKVDYINMVYVYLSNAPEWVLWLMLAILIMILTFLLREFCCWLFRENKKIKLMEEQNFLLNKMNGNIFILTQKLVGSGYKREDEKG
jgi:sensor domain CHASE-containing protein